MRQWPLFIGGLGVLILVLSAFTTNDINAIGIGLTIFSITLALSANRQGEQGTDQKQR